MFVYQAEKLDLVHAVLCTVFAVGDDPFVVLLADVFLYDYEPCISVDRFTKASY